MQQPATPTDLTLSDVKLHFEHWRETRAKRGKIPDSLWLEVKTLLGRYSTSQITQTLGINAYQISSGVTHKNQFTFVSARPALSNKSAPILLRIPVETNSDFGLQANSESGNIRTPVPAHPNSHNQVTPALSVKHLQSVKHFGFS